VLLLTERQETRPCTCGCKRSARPRSNGIVARTIARDGAGILVVFTALATLLAYPFWVFEPGCGRQTATFIEHSAGMGGRAAAALLGSLRGGFITAAIATPRRMP
jgi:hypothetical protein